MAGNPPSLEDAAIGMSMPIDFATPTPEGRARYEQTIRDTMAASERTEQLTMRLRAHRQRNLETGHAQEAGGGDDDAAKQREPQMDESTIARLLASEHGKEASKQMMELNAEDTEAERRMCAAITANMDRYRPVLVVAHPIDPNGGGQGSSYTVASHTHFFRSATKAELRRQAEDNAAFAHPAVVATGAQDRLPAQHARDVRAEKMTHIEQCIQIVGNSTINAFDHVRIGRMITSLVQRMERGELGPEECERLHAISASYDRLVVTFVPPMHHRPRKQARTRRRGKPQTAPRPTEPSSVGESDRRRMDAQPRPKKGAWPTFHCKRCTINGRATPNQLPYGTLSRDVLCDMCAVQLHAGVDFAQTAAAYAVASSPGFSRTDEQVAFHEAVRQAGDEARAAAAQPDSPRPPMVIHPSGNIENFNDEAYLKACLPLVYGKDWERMSNAVIAEFRAQATAAASSDDDRQ